MNTSIGTTLHSIASSTHTVPHSPTTPYYLYGSSYTTFLLVLVFFVLCISVVMCAARIIFVYCSYRRSRRFENDSNRNSVQTEEADLGGHPFSYLADERLREFDFAAPPPTYDQVFKRDEPPPAYIGVPLATVSTPMPPISRSETAPQYPAPAFSRNQDPQQIDIVAFARQAQEATQRAAEAVGHALPTAPPMPIEQTRSAPLPTGVFGTSYPVQRIADPLTSDEECYSSSADTVTGTPGHLQIDSESREVLV